MRAHGASHGGAPLGAKPSSDDDHDLMSELNSIVRDARGEFAGRLKANKGDGSDAEIEDEGTARGGHRGTASGSKQPQRDEAGLGSDQTLKLSPSKHKLLA